MKCGGCEVDYPPHLLHEMYSSTRLNKSALVEICGICALERTNRIHGSTLEKFDGMAEQMRQGAINHRIRTRQVAKVKDE